MLKKIKQVGNAANSMSYWVFTDIFEEAGPRFTPFHGGFGMINTHGINKPVFYAYQFMNRLGNIELANNDDMSWTCKDSNCNIQALVWDFTNTHPGDSVNNQVYYIRDLPSKSKGKGYPTRGNTWIAAESPAKLFPGSLRRCIQLPEWDRRTVSSRRQTPGQ